jgi:hypothetical protein
MKIIYKIGAYALAILGLVHTLLTPLFYQSFSVDAL